MRRQQTIKKEMAANTTDIATYVTVQTTSFSGATLLGSLLAAHPQVATIAEMDGPLKGVNIETYLCSCGEKLKECDFWRLVKPAMQARGFEFNYADFGTRFEVAGPRFFQYLRKGSTRSNFIDSMRDAIFEALPAERKQLKKVVARNDALIDAVLNMTGKEVFVDTSKGRLRLRLMSKFSRFNVRTIHLIRDVRGVVASNLRRDPTTTVREAAEKWVKLHQRHERTLALLPAESYLKIRYEDLCQDVSSVLKRLYLFCGVNPEVEITDFHTIPQHIIGNKMRLRTRSEIRLDERWRNELTADQVKEIERIAGKLSRHYGY